jgi:signal transduction histidine kinase
MAEAILYVDDDVSNLIVLKASCEPEFRILTAQSAAEALDLAHQEEIAVFLVDQRMPQVSGVELLERVAKDCPEAIRILITAYSDLSAAIAAINQGRVNRYIRKPWEPEELKLILGEALDVYATRRRLRELERRLTTTERVYALGVIVSSIAHELRNPLTVALGSLDGANGRLRAVLAEEDDQGRAEKITATLSYLEKMEAAIQRISEIVASIDLSQRRSRADQQVDMAEVLRLTLAGLGSAFRRHGRLETDVRPVRPVLGSTTALGQVTLNLLVNSLESFPQRSGREHLVRVRLYEENEHVRLDVEDNGPGIPKEAIKRIFDPFFTTKPEGGTGLGLAISMKIVEELGGRITVESEPGKLTRFSVILPVNRRT